jgi:hypothetical protein
MSISRRIWTPSRNVWFPWELEEEYVAERSRPRERTLDPAWWSVLPLQILLHQVLAHLPLLDIVPPASSFQDLGWVCDWKATWAHGGMCESKPLKSL